MSIAIKTPHSNLTKSFASLGSLLDLSIARLGFSLVNKANMLKTCPTREARRRETWVRQHM
jgi:hypothetical protein